MSMPRIEPGADPTDVVLWAAVRFAVDFNLFNQESVLSVPNHPNRPVKINALADVYSRLAFSELEQSEAMQRTNVVDLAVEFARRAVAVATLLWPIRHQALQTTSTASVDDDAWQLLVAMATLLHVSEWVTQLVDWVTRVASLTAHGRGAVTLSPSTTRP